MRRILTRLFSEGVVPDYDGDRVRRGLNVVFIPAARDVLLVAVPECSPGRVRVPTQHVRRIR